MVFSELKMLFTDKKYRLYLVLFLWLLIGVTLFEFVQFFASNAIFIIAIIVFFPLLVFCVTMFIVSFVFRVDLKELSLKKILIIVGIAALFALLFTVLWLIIYVSLFILALISYVVITVIFYIYACYSYGVEWDDKIQELKTPYNKILRLIVFIGGITLSFVTVILFMIIVWMYLIFLLVILILLTIISLFPLIKGKFNAWIGIFFLWVTLYTIFLALSIYLALNPSNNSDIWYKVGLYILDVFLIIYTITTLIGKKSEVLGEKLKFIKPDAILMWLIFSKASYEFGKALYEIGEMNLSGVEIAFMNVVQFGAILSFLIFLPLVFIAGLYGICKYSTGRKESLKES